jgi:hypothetical protein
MRHRLLVAAIAALTVCSAAAAHGGGGALGFRSTVTRITPAVAGLIVTVLDSDDRLDVTNTTGKRLVVAGYEGEPYLEFRDGRVYRNVRSPATYLNDDRFGEDALAKEADPKAQPRWQQVSEHERYEWHDHRIHWMSKSLPPKVRAAEDQPHHVFDWKVPATLDGEAIVITGSLDYDPPPEGRPTALIGALVVISAAGVAAVLLRRRRERPR